MYFKVTVMKQLVAAILLVFAMQSAWAIGLPEAKSLGLVGEGNRGYLVAVKQPASDEVKALVRRVNAKRKAQFERAAGKTNTTVPQVSNRFYELAIQRTRSGHFYQDKNGRWKKK